MNITLTLFVQAAIFFLFIWFCAAFIWPVLIATAKAAIEQEVHRAKDSLRDQVAELAVAGARKILGREVDAKAHADLLAALQKQL